MGFLNRLFDTKRAPKPTASALTAAHSSELSSDSGSSSASRRELLRAVLHDTLNRHGIPTAWVSAEALAANSRSGERGIHWRLVIRHWDPRLLTHGLALQQALADRVTAYDPRASAWLMGFSWQFALADESVCPPLPQPAIWARPPAAAASAAPAAQEAGIDPAEPIEDARADLEKLFAVRDADYHKHASGEASHEATQPMFLRTEPAPL